jgi:membrane protein DedA with SNARE-associated domain
MFSEIEVFMMNQIETLPLELFVFIASFIEEVVAPVPSSAVLLLTGSFAAIQERTLLELLPLAFLAALGKTLGAILVYFFADKIGAFTVPRFGKYFGISKEAITSFGEKITGGPRDYLLLIAFRALPIVPSSVVSIGCGLLKIPFKLFLITTLIGTIVRDIIFLYIGYRGTQVLNALATHTTNIESLIQTIFLIFLVAVLAFFYFRRKKSDKVSI